MILDVSGYANEGGSSTGVQPDGQTSGWIGGGEEQERCVRTGLFGRQTGCPRDGGFWSPSADIQQSSTDVHTRPPWMWDPRRPHHALLGKDVAMSRTITGNA